jgi:hypothetical protein
MFIMFISVLLLCSIFYTFPPTTTESQCAEPVVTIEPWHIKTFRPKWFGRFGEPSPIVYKTKSPKPLRVYVVAVDKRGIEVRLRVDDIDQGYQAVELDQTIECGEDVDKCIELGFGYSVADVPPGKHTVKAEIVKGACQLISIVEDALLTISCRKQDI